MPEPKPLRAKGEPVPKTWTVVLPAGETLLTPDFYSVRLAQPVHVEIPDDALEPIDEA
ncbi:MAG: hypothetical protein ACQGVC_17065 [Myxococcota bacterium]